MPAEQNDAIGLHRHVSTFHKREYYTVKSAERARVFVFLADREKGRKSHHLSELARARLC